jgi:hypothetical protein
MTDNQLSHSSSSKRIAKTIDDELSSSNNPKNYSCGGAINSIDKDIIQLESMRQAYLNRENLKQLRGSTP